jgi:hypothetical protein
MSMQWGRVILRLEPGRQSPQHEGELEALGRKQHGPLIPRAAGGAESRNLAPVRCARCMPEPAPIIGMQHPLSLYDAFAGGVR